MASFHVLKFSFLFALSTHTSGHFNNIESRRTYYVLLVFKESRRTFYYVIDYLGKTSFFGPDLRVNVFTLSTLEDSIKNKDLKFLYQKQKFLE